MSVAGRIVFELVREPILLGVTLLFLFGFGLPLSNVFSKLITDKYGKRITIFRRCLMGEVSLWIVYWLFGAVGNVLVGIATLFIGMASSNLGHILFLIYVTWWVISLWQCAGNTSIGALKYLVRFLLTMGLLIGIGVLFDLFRINKVLHASVQAASVFFLVLQFVLVYVVTYCTSYSGSRKVTHRGTSGFTD